MSQGSINTKGPGSDLVETKLEFVGLVREARSCACGTTPGWYKRCVILIGF